MDGVWVRCKSDRLVSRYCKEQWVRLECDAGKLGQFPGIKGRGRLYNGCPQPFAKIPYNGCPQPSGSKIV